MRSARPARQSVLVEYHQDQIQGSEGLHTATVRSAWKPEKWQVCLWPHIAIWLVICTHTR